MKFTIIYIVAIILTSVTSSNIRQTKLIPEGRISRGQNATIGQFPYTVRLVHKPDPKAELFRRCTGSLIGNEWILTAAHCIKGMDKVKVALGAIVKTHSEVEYTVSSEYFVMHPDFDSTTYKNDIALIEIPLTNYTANINAVRLPSFASIKNTYSGATAEMSGWGRTSVNNTYTTHHLQWAKFKVIANALCAQSFPERISDSNICIATEWGISPCKGDSGGPLVLESTNTQIGLSSFGIPFGCQSGSPEVFTRTSSYLDWIKQHTNISY